MAHWLQLLLGALVILVIVVVLVTHFHTSVH